MLTTTALTSNKNHMKKMVVSAKYKVGSTYYKAPIQDAKVLSDGRLAIDVLIDHSLSGNITVTEVQLYDVNGNLWAKKAESISRADVQEGILYRFAFTITEEET